MRLKILENKSEFITSLNERIINLLGLTIIFPNFYSIEDITVVDEYQEMRMDTIAFQRYGSSDYVDGLMKFNGISNPFSVEKGDVLLIPSKKTLDQSYVLARSIQDQKLALADFIDDSKTRIKQLGIPPTFVSGEPKSKRIVDGRIILE